MPAMIQVRNVPEGLHRRLKSRAALAGMSLSDYLLSGIHQMAELPTIEELRAVWHAAHMLHLLSRRPRRSAPNAKASDRNRRFVPARSVLRT